MSRSGPVLITGASGFIGCRVAERLVLEHGLAVRAMIHRPTGPGLARLARLPVEFVQGNLLDPESIDRAARGVDAVVHCAFGSRGSAEEMEAATVGGTRHVLDAASRAGARRIVHLSTISVYGKTPAAERIDESMPRDPGTDLYARTKADAEKVVTESTGDIETVILRPGIVYGPHGNLTVGPVKDILSGAVLVDEAQGLCNVIYIDNLVDAIILSLEHEVAAGDDFIVVDDDVVTWGEYYGAYSRRLPDAPPIRKLSREGWQEIMDLRDRKKKKKALRAPLTGLEVVARHVASADLKRKLSEELEGVEWVRTAYRALPLRRKEPSEARSEAGVSTEPEAGSPALDRKVPGPGLVRLYDCRTRYSNEKIKQRLGWRQRISFDEAMDLTEPWARTL